MTGMPTPSGVVVAVTDDTYHEVVLTGRAPTLVAFMSGHSSCRALRPVLDELARDRAASLVVATVDVEANPALAHTWGITDVPVMLLFAQGNLERVLRGVRPYARLAREIDETVDIPPARYAALG